MANVLEGGIPVDAMSALNRRRTVRQYKNPMDRCTVVSILPKDIFEVKHTIEPGVFKIPAGSYEKPSTLIVTGSSWWRDIDIEQPMMEIPVSSIQIAESIVNDYCNGMVGCNMNDCMPGLFFVLGAVTVSDIEKNYQDSLNQANAKQRNWFQLLVKLGDSLWARSNGNPLVISDEMRMGAQILGLDKVWIKDFQTVELSRCLGCGGLRNPDFPICPTCKLIDPNHPLAKDMKFAV